MFKKTFAISLFLAGAFVFVAHAQSSTCANYYQANIPVSSGYGAAFDVNNTSKLLVKVACDTGTPSLQVGDAGSNRYIYKQGYVYVNSAWQPISLTSNSALVSSAWYPGFAQGTLPAATSAWTYAVGYLCTWSGSAWKCGCADTACTTSAWQLQAYMQPAAGGTPTGGGTGGGGSAPVGGPGGYTTPILNDSFGSSKSGANITSLSQFNPSTPYGENGTGWDRFMKGWGGQGPCDCANIAMQADDLDIMPGNQGPDFIVSHFEFFPTASTRYYVEVREITGRGGYNGQTWPAIWFFSGNEPGANNQRSEFDGMEIWDDLSFGTQADANGLYTHYYTITTMPNNYEKHTITTDNDITTNYNVYGYEFYLNGSGQLMMDAYLNGAKVGSLSQGFSWISSNPAIIIGYNPGSTSYSPAVMKLDYVRVWKK